MNLTKVASLTACSAVLMSSVVWAGCPCEKNRSHVYSAPVMSGSPYVAGETIISSAPVQQARPMTTADASLMAQAATPPGFLGRTYELPSRDIPADKHPRVAIVDVLVDGAIDVEVYNVYPHREEDLVDGFQDEKNSKRWRFETKPLIPHNPHIYKIVVTTSQGSTPVTNVKYIRLVPGRVLEVRL